MSWTPGCTDVTVWVSMMQKVARRDACASRLRLSGSQRGVPAVQDPNILIGLNIETFQKMFFGPMQCVAMEW